ncbi:MAG: pilus assembly protein [Deltaproteobacteria bacterium]|nr:pilus assembly protein [Deltaproteobacteria bacterium]
MATFTKRRRGGSSALEFALVAPVLVGMLAGVADYGWYFSERIALVGAVRDAVRAGATTSQDDARTPEETAEDAMIRSLEANGYKGTVYLDINLEATAPNQTLSVSATLPYRPLIGILPTPESMRSAMVMRLEDQPDF